MMGNKRLGCCSAGDRLHHRRFNFEVILVDHVITDQGDDLAALAKHLSHIRVHNQVKIALAIAGFHVGQAMPFFRQRQQRLGQKLNRLGAQRKFICLGAERTPFNANDVTKIELAKKLKALFTDEVFSNINLKTTGAILNLNKRGFAKITLRHNPAGDLIGRFKSLKGHSIMLCMSRVNFACRGIGHKTIGKRVVPLFAKVLEFSAPLSNNFVATYFFLCSHDVFPSYI